MKFGSVAIAYREGRFLGPHLQHLPDWIDEKIVLQSIKPWFGKPEGRGDGTTEIAQEYADKLVRMNWASEQDQRNTGQILHENKDWVIVLDPDEFLDNFNWQALKDFLEFTEADAVVAGYQRVFWKNKEVHPHGDYQQLIAVRPHVPFVDKRVVGTSYVVAPVELLHFSWARTDKEIKNKINHYAHANDFDADKWYNEVWLNPERVTDLHPVNPPVLRKLIDPVLPAEIDRLNLWP